MSNFPVEHQFEFLILLSELRVFLSALSVKYWLGIFNAEYAEGDAEFAEQPSEQHVISK